MLLRSEVRVLALMLLAPLSALAADPPPAHPLSRAVREGSVSLDLRYRFESVEQEDFDERARASLLRSRVQLESARVGGVSAFLEVDNVSAIGVDDYNSTENGKVEFPTIADPEGTNVNQAWLEFAARNLNATLGRQRILLDNMRIIGSKPWRNNEQTYDGLRLRWQAMPALAFDGSYVNQVNRIFGPDDGANPARWHGDNFFLHATYGLAQDQELVAFAYLLDVDAQSGYTAGQTVNNSSDSFGLEYRGEFSEVKLRAAVVTQTDAAASELDYRAPYYVVEVTAPLAGVRFTASHEVLGSDNDSGFDTPLANGHRHNGWADMFLSTPGDGLRDTSLSVEGKVGALGLTARYHDFRAEASSVDFGSELDLQAHWEVSERLTATLKAAVFDSKSADRYADTTKAWVILRFRL
jgi:hypothetical protein